MVLPRGGLLVSIAGRIHGHQGSHDKKRSADSVLRCAHKNSAGPVMRIWPSVGAKSAPREPSSSFAGNITKKLGSQGGTDNNMDTSPSSIMQCRPASYFRSHRMGLLGSLCLWPVSIEIAESSYRLKSYFSKIHITSNKPLARLLLLFYLF